MMGGKFPAPFNYLHPPLTQITLAQIGQKKSNQPKARLVVVVLLRYRS